MDFRLVRADIVVVGAPSREYAALIGDYEQRLGRYTKLTVHELKGAPLQRGEAHVLAAERDRLVVMLESISASTSGSTTIVACDSRGRQLDTPALAGLFVGAAHLVLVIGGAFGLHPDVVAMAQQRIAFGAITLPHQLARLVATEQLYRSMRIARGEPYHH